MSTTPGRTMSKAGDLVRAFNHDTIFTGDGWQYPPHAYDAIGSLAYLVRMLPQAIEQTMRPVQRTHDDGRRVTVDGGGDPARAVAELQAAIADATNLARLLSAAVDRMHSASSPLGLDTRGLPGFGD
ncbi:hypothetical protein ABZX77_30355 [Streptomyces sp. NPDC004237]|uniref:hypothetical protein n=1 Tax=Streptomyces sp. NPDC004237 TaxID=3154455 RepID=UPI0033B1131F